MRSFMIVCLMLVSLSACQISSLYDARPLQKGEKAISILTNSTLAEDLGNSTVSFTNQVLPLLPIYPGLEYSWGTNLRSHMTIGVSLNQGIYTGANIGILNPENKKFAMSFYPVAGISPFGGAVLGYLRLPLLISLYPTEKLSITMSPGAILSSPLGSNNDWINVGTGNLNLLYGRKSKFGISFGLAAFNGAAIGQCSLGYSFRFGGK